MRIRYETTIDDLIALNCFHIENSPTLWRQRLIYALLVPILLVFLGLLLTLVFWFVIEDPIFLIIFAVVFIVIGAPASVGWYFFGKWYWMVLVERNVRKLYAEGSNQTILGWREMEVIGDRLLLNTEFIEYRIDLGAIKKIVGNEIYTFVYIASTEAYMIPMNLYPEGEYRQFVADLREAWENRKGTHALIAPTKARDERIAERPI